MYLEGINDMSFYLGDDVPGEEGTKIGLVNIAAFLAQSMKETIKYDSCDENNWDINNDGQYPISNACGQLEQSYQHYTCPNGTEHFQCEVDPNMEMVATTHAHWYGAPGPLFCGPKSKYPYTGFWDYEYECDFPWLDPPEYCSDYPGQKGGRHDRTGPVMNGGNRIDVEGCCWWGRGVIQTTGICNFGMLNYFLGRRAADEGRPARYGTIDFCKDPSAICNRSEHPELKWIAGMFYWMSSLQPYDNEWNYMDSLKEFVRGGMQDGGAFIDAVSGIVNRGCHNPPCGTGVLDGGQERKENFKKVLEVLFAPDGSLRIQTPSNMPSISSSSGQDLTADTSQPQPQPRPTPPLGSNGAEDKEEDWSHVSEVNNALNLWCGATISEASDNCGRNGYNCPEGTCPTNDLKCFMLFDESCDVAPGPLISTTPPPSSGPTSNPSAKPTAKPSPKPSTNIGDKSEVRAQNYCAKRHADLKTGCFTAQTCNDDVDPPCPVGTYCWGNIVCAEETQQPSLLPSNAPSQSPVAVVNGICATNYPELQKTCWNAAPCSNINPCSDGQKCFENIDCNFVSPKLPAPSTINPTLQPTKSSGGDETISSVELYCAVSESALKKSCASARRCVDDELCPLGMICIPFDCEQKEDVSSTSSEPGTDIVESDNNDSTLSITDNSHELCPDFFIGWHTRADCKEYFECNNGQIGPLYSCGENFKFDKVSGKCLPENRVNQYCYGINEASIDDSSNTESNASVKSKCILGYTGWDAKPGCSQYYWCSNGNEGASLDCGGNLLFDLELELCNFADKVDCPYDAPTSSPTRSKQVTLSPSQSPKVVSESDGLAEFDRFPTSSSPTSTNDNAIPAIPPWLNDIRITSNDGVASAVPVHLGCFVMSLLSITFLAYFDR